MKKKILSLILIIACLIGCEKEASDPNNGNTTQATDPWLKKISMGNFSINTANILTTEDGVSVNYITDYVNSSSLPSVNFDIFSLNILVPTSVEHITTVESVNVQLTSTTGVTTNNIYNNSQSSFLQQQTIAGQLYSVYRMAGSYNGSSGAFNRTNFANIVFTAQIFYKKNGTVVANRTSKLEIYKR